MCRFQVALKQHFTRLRKHLTVAMVAVGGEECDVGVGVGEEVDGVGKMSEWVCECVEKICRGRASDGSPARSPREGGKATQQVGVGGVWVWEVSGCIVTLVQDFKCTMAMSEFSPSQVGCPWLLELGSTPPLTLCSGWVGQTNVTTMHRTSSFLGTTHPPMCVCVCV